MTDIVLNGKTFPISPAIGGDIGDGQGDDLLSGLFSLLVAAEIEPDENGDFVLDEADLAGLEQQATNDGEADPAIAAALLMLAQAARASGIDNSIDNSIDNRINGGVTSGKSGGNLTKGQSGPYPQGGGLWAGMADGATGSGGALSGSSAGQTGLQAGLVGQDFKTTMAGAQTPDNTSEAMVKLSETARQMAEKTAMAGTTRPSGMMQDSQIAGVHARADATEAGDTMTKNALMAGRQMPETGNNGERTIAKTPAEVALQRGEAGRPTMTDEVKMSAMASTQMAASTKTVMADNHVSASSGGTANTPLAALSGGGEPGQGGQQNGGQQGFNGTNGFAGQGNAGTGARLGDTLDMMSRDWQEKLIDRVEKSFRSGEAEIDLTLSPKSLGRMRVSLGMVNGQVDVMIKADSAAAANLLGESETRLSQMLEANGLRIGQFSTGTGGDFGRGGAGQNGSQAGNAAANAGAETAETETASSSPSGMTTDNVVNVTA